MPIKHTVYIYEKIAQDLEQAIRQGVYAVHDRLPSLRGVSQDYAVSMSTAMQAYQRLEEDGLIEARPKSGYFVRPLPKEAASRPAMTQPTTRPTTVNVAQLAMDLVEEVRSARLTKLGAAVPGADLLPLATLSRTLAGIARRHPQVAGQYENCAGNALLRKQIARLMRDAAVHCSPDEVIVTNGCLEALQLALRAVTKPGDTVAIESPTYFGVLQAIEASGLKALELATDADTGVDPDALAKALQRHNISACILMPSFNNPLGSSMPDSHKRRVVALLLEHGVPLIEDDVYGAVSYTRPRPRAVKAYDEQNNVIYCSSFSKTVAPGLRIGWLLPGRFHAEIRYLKFLDNISTAVHPQLAMAEFLARGRFQHHIQKTVRIYQKRVAQMHWWIREYFPPETKLSRPTGGFLLWVELPAQFDCLKLYHQALDNRIAISPGLLFSAQGQYRHHIRLSCGAVGDKRLQTSIKTLGQLIANQ